MLSRCGAQESNATPAEFFALGPHFRSLGKAFLVLAALILALSLWFGLTEDQGALDSFYFAGTCSSDAHDSGTAQLDAAQAVRETSASA